MKDHVILGLLLILAAACICVDADRVCAGSQDTVADVSEAAQEGIPDVADLKQGVDDINAVLKSLSTDSTYASNFFNLAKSNDRTNLLGLIRQRSSKTTVAINQLTVGNSFFLVVGFITSKGKKLGLCISTDAAHKCPNGKSTDIIGILR
jgi:hypothetical protein